MPSKCLKVARFAAVAALAIAACVGLAPGAAAAPQVTKPEAAPASAPADAPRVLVFSRTLGFRHDSIPDGIQAIQELFAGRFNVDATEDPTRFTDENLRRYKVVVFLSTTGDVLNDGQQAAFERFIRAGGGYAGVHAAADTEYSWPWYGTLVGAYFRGHPPTQEAVVVVEDRAHPTTKMLPERWKRTDEWYSFKTNPRSQVHVLASLDETTYQPAAVAMGDHPIAWCHEFDGGRAWYTALGHTKESFRDPLFRQHLREGIAWAAHAEPSDAPPAPAGPAPKVSAPAAPAAKDAPATPARPGAAMLPAAIFAQAPAPAPAATTNSTHIGSKVPGADVPGLPKAPPDAPMPSLGNAALLAGVVLAAVIVLGSLNSGLKPALLAWLIPGGGYFALGYRRRGILAATGVIGMLLVGVLVGGLDAVDSVEDTAWFIPQSGNGPIVFALDAANQALLKTGRVGELLLTPAPLDPYGRPVPGSYTISSYKGLGPANEFGTLFIALGGMMNMLLVMDASRRDPAQRPDA
ncbi:MAG: ThuA domain-containing protein [Phycisphaerales bacterium]